MCTCYWKKQNRKLDLEVAQYLDYATVIENKGTIAIKLIINKLIQVIVSCMSIIC